MYVKEKGGWSWVQQKPITKKPASPKLQRGEQETEKLKEAIINDQIEKENEEPEVVAEDVEIVIPKKEMPALLAVQNQYFAKTKLSSGSPQVLGAETIRELDGIYFFTPEIAEQEHYAITFLKNIFAIINTRINFVINFFLN